MGLRVGAALFDIIVVGAVFVGLSAVAGNLDTSGGKFNTSLSGGPFLGYVAFVIIYYGVAEALWQRTLGKALFGLRVVDANREARPAVGQVVVRTVMRIIDVLPLLYLIGFVSVLVTGERQQRLGDLLGGTTVARR